MKPSSYKIAADINDVPDNIVDEVLACEVSGRNYRVMPAELKFYRKMGLPVPKKHFFERYKARLEKRLPYELFDRKCDKCGSDVATAWSPERPEKIYCEECYLKTVY